MRDVQSVVHHLLGLLLTVLLYRLKVVLHGAALVVAPTLVKWLPLLATHCTVRCTSALATVYLAMPSRVT